MKGIIFNLLERAVVEEHDEDTWDDLLDAVGSDGVYASVGQYPDEEVAALVGAVADRRGVTPREALEWFGRRAIPYLVEAYPAFFERTGALRPFLASLNDVIHPEVRKLYPGAEVPWFDMATEDDGTLTMTYRSSRSMCDLAVGFARGAARHFAEDAAVGHRSCVHDGDELCVIAVAPG